MPMTDLSGRVAIVTGSGANIGEACARALAKAGAAVILADIAVERAELVARPIQASGGQATGMFLDLAQEDSITALVEDVIRYRIDQADLFVRSCQQQSTAIRCDVTAVECGHDIPSSHGRKQQHLNRMCHAERLWRLVVW